MSVRNIFSPKSWKNMSAFKNISYRNSQLLYYKKNNANAEVLKLVALESRPFGIVCEKLLSEILHLGPRTSSQNDATFDGKKIEIKCARYWAGKDDCKWQHFEPEYDYEYVLVALLDFQKWKVWGIKKSFLMGELRDKKILTFQGKQGWWTMKKDILPYLTPINSTNDLEKLIKSQT